jgi:hypothetical protein
MKNEKLRIYIGYWMFNATNKNKMARQTWRAKVTVINPTR